MNNNQMFCFQCQQTAKGTGCTGKAGVCGKTSEVSNLQDKLTGALIGLAYVSEGEVLPERANRLVIESLFTTVTNADFDAGKVQNYIDEINAEKEAVLKNDPDRFPFENYDMNKVWYARDEDIRSLKSLILFGMRGMSAYAYHALVLGFIDKSIFEFIQKGLRAVGSDTMGADELFAVVLETGRAGLDTMKLLDEANTGIYGNPEPVEIDLSIEKGPFIVVSGHDYLVLEEILKQTEGKGINVYTHCEMLPANAYPGLTKYPHLKGNFGTAWERQQKEFIDIPAPVVFTTNCLMPPKANYADRIYTTEVVGYPGLIHIGPERDFSAVIEQSLRLGGYSEDHPMTGINGGGTVMTGFAHHAVLSHAAEIVEAVKNGTIKHFYLVGGCDGAWPSREYYTNFVKDTPPDTIILTCACGKFRFNDINLGTAAGLPRLLDLGQCNDSYSGIKIALALADAFGCGVNELPLSFVISWYEQKAVCILLALLYLGIENIQLGPSLPAFLSPNILNTLVEKYKISTNGSPETDIEKFAAVK